MSTEPAAESDGARTSSLGDIPARLKHHRLFLRKLVIGFSDEDWLQTPADGMNSAHWILGHLVWGRLTLLRKIGEEIPGEDWESDFSIGSQPDGSRRIEAVELQGRFRILGRLLVEKIESMEEEQLSLPLEKPMPDGANTVAGLVRFMCFHESYHIGQLGLLRRLLGKPGLA